MISNITRQDKLSFSLTPRHASFSQACEKNNDEYKLYSELYYIDKRRDVRKLFEREGVLIRPSKVQ